MVDINLKRIKLKTRQLETPKKYKKGPKNNKKGLIFILESF
jgi:hypothetical protein